MRFGGLRALHGVNLAVGRGEIRGLIGPNGAGKTTLLNVVAGAVSPTAGTVEFNGRILTGRSRHDVSAFGIARTFQNLALFGGMTVLENVMVGLHRQVAGPFSWPRRGGHGESWASEAAMALLQRFCLEPAAYLEVEKLSVADRKRVELVRALATKPTLLLLDEPAAGLSAVELRDLIELLRAVRRREGIAVILVEHNMELVMELCDRLTVLNFGEVLAEGAPAEVRSDSRVMEAYLGKLPA